MSVSSIGVAISRIKVATEDSMIAVFRVYGSESSVNAVFDNTILTKSLVNTPTHIGSYHKNMDMGVVLDEIVEGVYAQ